MNPLKGLVISNIRKLENPEKEEIKRKKKSRSSSPEIDRGHLSYEIFEEFNVERVVLPVFLIRSSIKSSSFARMKLNSTETFVNEHEISHHRLIRLDNQ
ncbi:MAG: hypothetical protein ACTS73_08915 [Arsenophonus sp. NEOnobi-MAG3]